MATAPTREAAYEGARRVEMDGFKDRERQVNGVGTGAPAE